MQDRRREKTQPDDVRIRLRMTLTALPRSAMFGGKRARNQYIALRKCDSRTDVIRTTRSGEQPRFFGGDPFRADNGFATPSIRGTPDNRTSILSLPYSLT